MKQSTRSEEDEDVFEFRDEDNPEPFPWSAIYSNLARPNSNDHESPGTGALVKEIPTVTLDDDDDDDNNYSYSTDDSSAGPLESPQKLGCELSEGFCPMSDRFVKQHCGFTDISVDQKNRLSSMQMKVFTQLGPLPDQKNRLSSIPESSCGDGAVYFGELDSNDMVQDSYPSTPNSELEENNDPTVGQAHSQSFYDLDMDLIDAIAIHTDYVAYGDKYFPASLILISGDSIKLKTQALEEESEASSSEWKVDDILNIETQCSSLANVAKVRIRLLAKDSSHAEIANKTSGAEVVELLVPNWSQQKQHIMSLRVRHNAVLGMGNDITIYDGDADPLGDSESSSDPYIPNFEEPFEEVVYPKGELDAVSVRKSDVDLLQPEVFVNDTIIDFYITFLRNGIPHERRHNFHFFSSFFFRKLADLDKNPSSVSDGKAAFQRVRRWTRKVNIFEKDYIFIPVNYNLHWSLVVLCHPGEVANFNDEDINEALKVPCILHMDSIRGSHAGLKDLFQSYLLEEWRERGKDTAEDIASKFLNLRFLSLELPQQENCSDCGLFLLHYAELFIDEAPLNFSPFRINKFDHFLKQDWFVPAEASLKRAHIQRLIYELLKSRSHECVSSSRNNLSHSPALPVNKENDNGIEIISEKRSPEKTWNGSAFYTEPVLDMDIGLLNMSLQRPSGCIDSSDSGMTELLEPCQLYGQRASLGQLGVSLSSITEVKIDGDLAHPDLGQMELESIDRAEEPHIDSSSQDHNQRFQRNPEDASSSDSRSCDNSSEKTRIRECQNEDKVQPYKTVDSQIGFDSAPGDIIETPPDDAQDLAEIPEKNSNHDQVSALFSNLEGAVNESREELVNNDDERWIVENSPEDQDRPAKRVRWSFENLPRKC
ncbi:putative ubiquitin-like-specific protease 2B [Silene latifolia]|uniref:putative ubiquitin-like-specific protease 2B n=1 Tax=Silene latifolia TaxID=37657 RepID=UPI003D773AFE